MIARVFYLIAALWLLSGCSNANEKSAADENSVSEFPQEDYIEAGENSSENEEEESGMDKENEVSSEETGGTGLDNATSDTGEIPLSYYSNEQIEYARVWLQLGANQEIDGLYAREIPAGTPLNPDDETSAAYPEDVIQLAGSRLVDGSVTYSGNGDGTINLYQVPLRWDGEYPAGEDFYTEIIDNTEMVSIDVGEDEEVIRLTELLQEQP